MSAVHYKKVGGVQCCITHCGIVDECSDRDGRCDMSSNGHRDDGACRVRTLWIQTRGAK